MLSQPIATLRGNATLRYITFRSAAHPPPFNILIYNSLAILGLFYLFVYKNSQKNFRKKL